jgi:hypothetical protein
MTTPADIILQQLGGSNRLKIMIGAHDFFSSNNGNTLQFKFKMCKIANFIKVTLDPSDTYTVEFIKIGRRDPKTMIPPVKTVGLFKDVYNDMLKSVIENFTCLRIAL